MKNALITTIIFTIASLGTQLGAKCIRTTSYCPQEPGGFYSCTGKRLHRGDCAADLSIYPLGTTFDINGTTYTVADCGSAVCGSNHIDIFCPTRREMNERGTIMADVGVLSVPQRSHSLGRSLRRSRGIYAQDTRTLRSCVYSSKHQRRERCSPNNDILLASD